MSYHYLPEQVADCLEPTLLVGTQSGMSNLTTIANELLPQESKTESLTTRPSSAMSEHSLVKGTPQAIRAWLMSCQQDFPANHLATQASNSESMTNETCGQQLSNVLAWLNQDTHSWKTSQAYLLADTLEPSFETWPCAGTMQDGVCYRQPSWERRICEIESGLLPTVCKNEYKGASRKRYKGSRDYRGAKMSEALRDKESDPSYLHPDFAEGAMMWPITWTALAPLEMGKYRQWLQQHGICSPPDFIVYGDRPLPDWCNE